MRFPDSYLVRIPYGQCKDDAVLADSEQMIIGKTHPTLGYVQAILKSSNLRMVNVERGCLLTVDPPTKQYLLHLDERKEFRGRKFILKGYF